MSAPARTAAVPADDFGEAMLDAGVGTLAVFYLGSAIFMAAAPHAFFTAIGPFGAANVHYIRDTASFNAALGVGLLVSLRRPSWRVPLLAVATVQFALHTVNHLIDLDRAHPAWTGYFDFFSLLAGTVLLSWLLVIATGHRKRPDPRSEGDPR